MTTITTPAVQTIKTAKLAPESPATILRSRTGVLPLAKPRVTIARSTLKEALAEVSRALPNRNALPVLTHVLLSIHAGTMSLTTTDLSVAIQREVSATTHGDFTTTLPAKLLTDVVSALPDRDITLTYDADAVCVTLTAGYSQTTIKGMDATEFPTIAPPTGFELTLAGTIFANAIKQVAFAAATDDLRPTLTGILIRSADQQLVFAAADGFRLARSIVTLSVDAPKVELIPQASSLAAIAPLFAEDAEVKLCAGDTMLLVHTPGRRAFLRLIDGTFPDIDRVITKELADPTTTLTMDRSALQRAVKLAGFFAHNHAVQFSAEPDTATLTLSAKTAETGTQNAEIVASGEGEATSIALNAKFVAATLDAITTPKVQLALRSSRQPAIFRPHGDATVIYLVMPMAIQ